MKFENTEVMNFDGALRGMRNPKNSWGKSDSSYCITSIDESTSHCSTCPVSEGCTGSQRDIETRYIIGKNDMKLAQQLIRAGSEHRKFMRQIFISVDITAPLYWWKEFDTYKVGTVANSTSTMHKLATTPITLDCFETDDYEDSIMKYKRDGGVYLMQTVFIEFLEHIRKKYLETKDKKYWKELIRWLPESWLQTRTVTMSYENLLAICSKGQRRFHKLNEWSGQDDNTKPNFISWARTLPYAQELIFIDEVEE
ncbi:MAG: hypothetical protein HFI10_05760 [Lachnospiraceae bacterium]|jgi:hypothetical protein|nr:hypothetical protein [Lachnospiraceae bacterium]